MYAVKTKAYRKEFACLSVYEIFNVEAFLCTVLVVQWLGVALVIERLQVRLPAGALSSQLGQLSLPSLQSK